jgi:hypothetical protein
VTNIIDLKFLCNEIQEKIVFKLLDTNFGHSSQDECITYNKQPSKSLKKNRNKERCLALKTCFLEPSQTSFHCWHHSHPHKKK